VPAEVSDAYEDLRSALLDPSHPQGSITGRALMLRHGMLAWAQAWATTPAGPPMPRSLPAAAREPVPSDITPELVQFMAGLILRHHKEPRLCLN
jgi:hypothetical protein